MIHDKDTKTLRYTKKSINHGLGGAETKIICFSVILCVLVSLS
jgi:hypothetical protein